MSILLVSLDFLDLLFLRTIFSFSASIRFTPVVVVVAIVATVVVVGKTIQPSRMNNQGPATKQE